VALAARQRAPALLFALWTTDPPADWRSFGLARGLSVDRRALLLWDAEPLPGAMLAAYRRRSVQPGVSSWPRAFAPGSPAIARRRIRPGVGLPAWRR
jgi:hypothetical protein